MSYSSATRCATQMPRRKRLKPRQQPNRRCVILTDSADNFAVRRDAVCRVGIYEASFAVKNFFGQSLSATPRSVCVCSIAVLLFDMRLFGFLLTVVCGPQ